MPDPRLTDEEIPYIELAEDDADRAILRTITEAAVRKALWWAVEWLSSQDNDWHRGGSTRLIDELKAFGVEKWEDAAE